MQFGLLLFFIVGFYQWSFCKYLFEPHSSRLEPNFETTRFTKETLCEWLPTSISFIKLNFDGCYLGNLGQLGIEGCLEIIVAVLRAFLKLCKLGFSHWGRNSCLFERVVLGISNFLVEGDYAIVILWVSKKERGLWKFDGWLHQTIDISSKFGCSFS